LYGYAGKVLSRSAQATLRRLAGRLSVTARSGLIARMRNGLIPENMTSEIIFVGLSVRQRLVRLAGERRPVVPGQPAGPNPKLSGGKHGR